MKIAKMQRLTRRGAKVSLACKFSKILAWIKMYDKARNTSETGSISHVDCACQ